MITRLKLLFAVLICFCFMGFDGKEFFQNYEKPSRLLGKAMSLVGVMSHPLDLLDQFNLFQFNFFASTNAKAVDLGLPSGTKWADMNVGAKSPAHYGDYFAWGEIKPKKTYTSENSLTVENDKFNFDIAGNAKYDAATANWGSKWRMPTQAQMKELINKCTWTWKKITDMNGAIRGYGYRVTGPNGNSIFLPAAGHRSDSDLNYAGSGGNYWSSTPGEIDGSGYYACNLYFESDRQYVDYTDRELGRSVRPVLVE